MLHSTSSEYPDQRITELEDKLAANNVAIKRSITELNDYFMPRQIISRTLGKSFNKPPNRSIIAIIGLTGAGILARKFFFRKSRAFLVKTAVAALPLLTIHIINKNRL